MGIPQSKIVQEFKEDDADKGSVPSTPILTPKTRSLENLDPRSPSANIVRTPIQVLLTPETEVNKCDTFNINSPVPRNSEFEVRSPTTEFVRTPIVLPNDSKLPSKLHNKNFDNVRKTILNVTPKNIGNMPTHIPPKLLESSPMTKPVDNRRHSCIGLLETNLDYVETDLDEAYRQKEMNKKLIEDVNECIEGVSEIKTSDTALSETEPAEIKIETESTESQQKETKLTEPEPEETEPTEPQPEEAEYLKPVEPEIRINILEDLTTKPKDKNTKVETNVLDFDKKISSLIYTDIDANVVTPKKQVTNKQKEGNRTPLGIRNGQPKKKGQKLKVSDKPRRNEYAVSKIPVFKERKTEKQTENIPPKDLNLTKNAQWDNNTTLIL